jgi:hypothetical protein
MTYALTQDVPIDAAFYERIVDGLGDTPPKGLITHIALERLEGGLRYIDLWESKEDCDRFGEERLHPVVQPCSAKSSVTSYPKSPSAFLWPSSMSGVPSNPSSQALCGGRGQCPPT